MNTQQQGRLVFEKTMQKAQVLINEHGVEPAAVIAGLLGVITGVGTAAVGPQECARLLRLAALELDKTNLGKH